MRRAALTLFATISAFIFPSVYELAQPGPVAGASPTLSGAKVAYIPNGDFSGIGKGEVGTPPTNHDAETGSQAAGSPPTNQDFETGDLTGWTATGSPTVQSGGPTGYYAQLGSGQKLLSSAFTVDAAAQAFLFDIAAVNSGTFQMKFVIYFGAGYASSTTKYITSCPTTCTNWNRYQLDAVAWQGQSIKIEIQRYLGDVKVDNFVVPTEVFAGWTATSGENLKRLSGGPNGNHVQVKSASLTSQAFTVDSEAQNGQVDLKVDGGAAGYDIYVLSGTGYATSTKVYSGSSSHTSWDTRTFGLGDFAGQSVKIKVTAGTGSTISVDGIGTAKHVLPGWSPSGSTSPVALGADGSLSFAKTVPAITTGAFTADGSGYNGNTRGNWFRIVYMMHSNFNAQGTDIGSTLQVQVPGDVSPWFTAAGSSYGPPQDPVDIWIEKYFFVHNPASPTSPQPRGISFKLVGWPGFSSNPNVNYDGPPDVALIEMVDGPGPTKITGNSVARRGLPTAMYPVAGDTTTNTNDPVDVISGNYFSTKTDLAVPGLGVPLAWTRSYSAQANMNSLGETGPMGAKWSHNWHARLKEVDGGNLVQVSLAMGASLNFYRNGSTYRNPVGWEGSLVKNGGGDWTLTTANKLVYAFDSAGQWTSVTDRNGNTTTLGYTSGKLTSITDAGSRSLTITYDGNGRIESVSDGTRSVAYAYNAAGDLVEITDVMGGTITYQYSGHLLTQGTDAKGNVFVRNTYDSYGRVVQQLDADDGVTTIAYDTPGAGATRVTDQRGKQITYYFDQQMRITDVMDHDGGVTTTTWDANNNKTSVTNALGKTWTYTYDSRGNVLTATDPLSKTWTYTYNSNNDVLTVTDPLSRVTEYEYDASGNLVKVTDALNNETNFTVNASGLVTAVEDPLSNTTTFGYDSYGNRTGVTNALSKTWTFTYDGFGRVTEAEDPLGHSTTYTYNAANLVVTVTDELGNETSYTYDANGNVLTVTDANLNVTTYAYDDKDQLVSITDAESGTWTFAYDAVGNLVSKTNPRGKTTTYTYDNLGRLLTETDPLSNVRSYAYDLAGRLIARTDPKSQEIEYTYNDRNELTRIDYPDLSFVSFAYNDAGARTQMVDSTGTTAYAYDELYRLTSVTFPGSQTVSYGYDAASRRTSITYPGGSNQATYTYDAANRLTAVTGWDSNSIQYGYDDANRMTSATLPSSTGIVTSYTYDDADRLTGISHVKDGTTTVASVAYTLDDVGNRTQRVDQQGTHTYAYDDLYRLTSVTYPGPSTTTYAFDAFGNRTSMTNPSGSTTYTYDDADRITEVQPPSPASAIDYTWDDNGNLVERGADTFAWDHEDRMVAATVNSVTTTFAYRGDGLRDSRTVGMTTTTFTWDVNASLPVVLDDGNQYLYGAGLSAMKQSGDWFYYLADGLGSTMAVVDSTGMVVRDYHYDVYGAPTGGTGSLANEFDFAGQQTDPTGLQYLRARYYDPETGTFLSREPLAQRPGWRSNGQTYAGGSPLLFSDAAGTCIAGLWCPNGSEVSWCLRNPGYCAGSLYLTRKAWDKTIEIFQGFSETFHNDAADAFRHCYWSATLTLAYGCDVAKDVTDAHESATNNPLGEVIMDQWNNAVGRSIGEYFRQSKSGNNSNFGALAKLIENQCLLETVHGKLIIAPVKLPIPWE